MGLKARLRVQVHTEVERSQPKTEAKEASWIIAQDRYKSNTYFPVISFSKFCKDSESSWTCF